MADTPLGKMIIEMGLDDANFAKGITGVSKQITALKNDLKASQTSVSAFGKGIDGLESPLTIVTKQIDAQNKQLALLKKSYSGSLVDGKATASTQNYAAQISKANAQLIQYKADLKAAASAQYNQTALLPKMASNLSTVGKGLDSISAKALPATVAITGIFYKSIQAATTFDSQMTAIRALLSDGTPEATLSKQIETLSSKSKEWAKQYGEDTSDINDGIEEMIKKGYSYNQTIGAMPSILDAAKASGDDFATVMSNSTSILEEFNLKTKDTNGMMKNTQRVTDSLSYVANATAAGFSDMGEAMEYVGPVANGLGMTVEQTAAAVGLLSNNGIKGQSAGTGLRSVLTSLLKPSKQAAAAMSELGINLNEFKKGQIGLPDILSEITSKTDGMTKAQKSALLAQAFGTKGQTAMNVLVAQGADKLNNLTTATDKATGYTKKLADQMNSSEKNQFARAKATIETLGIDLGEKLLPKIVPVIKDVDDLTDSFDKLSPATQQTIIKMAITAAAIAPTAKALSGLTSIVGGVSGALGKLGAKGAASLALKGIETGAVDATAAVSGSGGLSVALGGLAPILAGVSPVAWAALGTAGLAGAIILANGWLEKLRDKQNIFGTINVPDKTYQEVKNFAGKVSDLEVAAAEFGQVGPKAFKDVAKAISDMGSAADTDISKATQKLINEAKEAGFGSDVINNIKNGGKKATSTVKTATDDMTNIVKTANKEQRGLNLTEQAQIATDQQKIAEQELSALNITGSKKKAVMEALTGDINKMSADQATDYVNQLNGILEKSDAAYKKKQADIQDELSHNTITQKQAAAQEKVIENEHSTSVSAYLSTLEKMILVQGQNLTKGTDQYSQWYQSSSIILSRYGVSLDSIINGSGEAIDAITSSTETLNTWNSIPAKTKELLGDNSNFVNSESNASQILKAWELANPDAKKLLAENLVKDPTMSAQQIINTLRGTTVGLFAVNKTGEAVNKAAYTLSQLQSKTVPVNANANPFNTTVGNILSAKYPPITIGINTSAAKKALGDSNFAGGLAWVNDQKGKLYKEMITLPSGESFVPQARDVIMPLPQGTSILKASETAKLIPKYATGTGGIPANAEIFKKMDTVRQQLVVNAPNADNSSQVALLSKILQALTMNGNNNDIVDAVRKLANRPAVSVFDPNEAANALTALITKKQAFEQSRTNALNWRS